MKTNLSIIVVLFCTTAGIAHGLEPLKTAASGCPSGIVVNLGRDLAGPLRPGSRPAAYVIERRAQGESGWRPQAEVAAPADLDDFDKRLKEAKNKLPAVLVIPDIPAQKLWEKAVSGRSADSLKFWAGVLQVRLALGTSYFDADAKRGASYEYRVSTKAPDGTLAPSILSFPVSWPGRTKLAVMRSGGQSSDGKSIRITWECGPGKRPVLFEARRRPLDGAFETVSAPVLITNPHNSFIAIMRDTTVTPMSLYQYVLVPLDYYGNPGAPSDTVLAGSYDFRSVPLPQSLSVAGVDSGGGLRLSWRRTTGGPVKSYQVFRSVLFDKGFAPIGSVAPSETSFVDRAIEPMTKYYYRIVLNGPRGEVSPPSATVFGVWQDSERPLPPSIIDCKGVPRGVQLTLRSLERSTVGFRIYRGRGYGATLSLITGLVPAAGAQTVFTDTSAGLSGSADYAYAARAENAAGRLSDCSDTVSARPLIANPPPAPAQLTATVAEGAVLLNWTDVQSTHPTLRGYRVYRAAPVAAALAPPSKSRKGAKGKQTMAVSAVVFEAMIDSLLPPSCNHCSDTLIKPGRSYRYAVTAVDAFGDTSALVTSSQLTIPVMAVSPPAELRAERMPGGVELSWSEVIGHGLSGFRIYRAAGKGQAIPLATVNAEQQSYIDASAQKGTLYFYWVTTLVSGQESGKSREIGIRR